MAGTGKNSNPLPSLHPDTFLKEQGADKQSHSALLPHFLHRFNLQIICSRIEMRMDEAGLPAGFVPT